MQENLNPADYYKKLDRPVKMLFKREVIRRLEWSERTFCLRMKRNDLRPAETMMIESIINKRSYLDV